MYTCDFNHEDAYKELLQGLDFLEYVNGKVIKCAIGFNTLLFDPQYYDIYNGVGSAQEAVNMVRDGRLKNILMHIHDIKNGWGIKR